MASRFSVSVLRQPPSILSEDKQQHTETTTCTHYRSNICVLMLHTQRATFSSKAHSRARAVGFFFHHQCVFTRSCLCDRHGGVYSLELDKHTLARSQAAGRRLPPPSLLPPLPSRPPTQNHTKRLAVLRVSSCGEK